MTTTEMKAQAWDSLMDFFRYNGTCLSYRDAVRAVGGARHLLSLLDDGKIVEVDNEGEAANSKRRFPADQVYSNVRLLRARK